MSGRRDRVPLTGRSNKSSGAQAAAHGSHKMERMKNIHGQVHDQILHKAEHHHHHVNAKAVHHAHAAGMMLSQRSDISAGGSARGEAPSTHSSAVSTSRRELTTARVEELNNPLEVFRPYSPEFNRPTAHLDRPPILPKSRHKLVPPNDPTVGKSIRRRKNICPPGFEEANLAPHWFETIDQGSALLDHETKVKFCREFIEKNRDCMWKYDLSFMGKSPNEVADMLTDNPGLLSRMKSYAFKERVFRLSSSDQFAKATNDDHLHLLTSRDIKDPFIPSMNTSRDHKAYEMTNLMTDKTAMKPWGSANCRGFEHTVEIGNFSKFTGLLNLNKESMLNR